MEPIKHQKTLVGTVVSTKMLGTAVVGVERLVRHPLYDKRYRKHKKYHADNSANAAVGSQVKIIETRPLAKTKRWKIVEVMGKKTKEESTAHRLRSRAKTKNSSSQ